MSGKIAIILFSDDFRIFDNPALYYACEKYENIIPLYVYNENYLGRPLGSASKIFLHRILNSFDLLLKEKYSINLLIKSGDVFDVLSELQNENKFDAVYFNHSYTDEQIKNENRIREKFKHLDVKSFNGKLLFEPHEIKPSSGSDYYRVFTPFSKECLKKMHFLPDSLKAPENIKSKHNFLSLSIDDLNLIPRNEGSWHKEVLKNWSFDYLEIEDNYINFLLNKFDNYSEGRNFPSRDFNSRISPYLRFGVLGVRWCLHVMSKFNSEIDNQFTLELLWREFAYHVMFYNPNLSEFELKEQYKNFKWENSAEFFEKWKNGQTGFELIDAGMIELWKTGFMHNRVRMAVSSFLIKDLLIDWRWGEKWFWEVLVDADPAVNPFSWQWVFGSGFDAAPYFRIFNPDSQKDRFDPDWLYCKKWLSKNRNYKKIVDHDVRRKIALERYKVLK